MWPIWRQTAMSPGLCSTMHNAVGFTRVMGESAFEESFLGKGQPYIFISEGIHIGDDVYKVLKDFISRS